MSWINVGAKDHRNGEDIQTKAGLKQMMRDIPEHVLFYTTSAFDEPTTYLGNELPKRVQLSVVGPDPYNTRKWYATVWPTGKVE